MHSAYLGVMRSLLICWILVREKNFSLSRDKIKILTNRIVTISKEMPRDFNRKLRPLKHLKRFKATELRQLLLYVLPIALHGIAEDKYYNHFMKFHCAIRILCTPVKCIELNRIASWYLKEFVSEFAALYCQSRVSFNVHSLLHIADDVRNFKQPLDDLSAFKFENYLQILKKKAKSGFRVLEQIYNRHSEEENCDKYFPIIKHVQKTFVFSTKINNNVIFIKNLDKIIKISRIIEETQDTILIDGFEALHYEPCYTEPINSSLIGMFKAQNNTPFHKINNIAILKRDIKKVASIAHSCETFFLVLIH